MAKILNVVLFFIGIQSIISDSEPQREQILFEKVDKNLDGSLTRAELDAVFLLFDTNADGTIHKSEFDADWVTGFKLGNQKEADLLFDKADANDDNVLNKLDLPYVFAFFDSNTDGNVSIDEFLTQWGALTLFPSGTQGTGQSSTPTTPDSFTFI